MQAKRKTRPGKLEKVDQKMHRGSRFYATALPVIIGLSAIHLSDPAFSRCNKSSAEVYSATQASVVKVLAAKIDPFSVAGRFRYELGSGIVFDDAGTIVTNAHVVFDATEIAIAFDEDKVLEGSLIGIDPISDLAAIRVKTNNIPVKKAVLGDANTLEIGDQVLAIGFPFNVGKTATRGIISGLERLIRITPMSWLTPLIQTDAAISSGNSGGPLVNMCGEVVGINTLAGSSGQNINFAIPIDIVQELVPQLLEHGRVIRPWHGVYGQPVPPILTLTVGIPPGLMIETVEPGSPAQKLGLRGGRLRLVVGTEEYLLGGDIITSVNGIRLVDRDTVVKVVESLKVGEKIKIEYLRDGSIQTAEVELPERPSLSGDVRRFYLESSR